MSCTINKFCKIFFLLSLAIILVAGLNPKDFSWNDAISSGNGDELRANKYSLAATESFLELEAVRKINKLGFKVSLSLVPPLQEDQVFRVITSFSNGVAKEQLLFGHWGTSLIVMTGNDFQNRSRQPRLYVDTAELGSDPWLLEFSFTANGSLVSNNGVQIGENSKFNPKLAEQGGATFITFGNAANRRFGWLGGIARFRLDVPSVDGGEVPSLLTTIVEYDFSKQPYVNTVSNEFNSEVQFLPMTIIKQKEWFDFSGNYFTDSNSSKKDILLNTVGFAPLGFFLCLLLLLNYRASYAALTVTLIMCLGLSLLIELLQGWLPPRHSTIYDVVFNSIGSIIGSLFAIVGYHQYFYRPRFLRRFRSKRK